MIDKMEKLRQLRERSKALDALTKAKQIVPEIIDHAASADGSSAPVIKRRFQEAHQRIYFTYRSISFVEKKEQVIQTETDPEKLTHERLSKLRVTRASSANVVMPFTAELPSVQLGAAAQNAIADESKEQIDKLTLEMSTTLPLVKPELTQKDVLDITQSQRFNGFFAQASKFLEKALISEEGFSSKLESSVVQGKGVEAEINFQMPAELKGSMVNHLSWSSLIPEICLSVYNDKDPNLAKNIPDKILVWNVNFASRPEFELNSGAKVSRAIFSPFHSEYVISGLECGRIYLYDLRIKKDPAMKSLPVSDGHKALISGLDFIGGQNSNNLVSISEEGKLCLWNLSKLDSPVKSIEILPNELKNKEELAFTLEPFCLSVIPGDTSSVYLGTSDAAIYQATVHTTTSSDRVLEKSYKSHTALITSLHHNRANSTSSLVSNAMLSGSLDWTVKLWTPKQTDPLYTFTHHNDPVTDLHWNPSHPALFVSADGQGKVCILDLYSDFDNPIWTANESGCVLNAKWDASGRCLAVSDENGGFKVRKFGAGLLEFKSGDVSVFENAIA